MDTELALIDLDGTVYSGNSPIDGVNDALDFLRSQDIETLFLTNYAGRKRDAYREKLEQMGLDISRDEVVTSGWLTAKYLSQSFPESGIFVLGEKGLKEEISDEGLKKVESPAEADILVVSNKQDLTYEELVEVLQGVDSETELVGTNPDETIPEDGGLIPGAGTVISAVETMLGKKAEIVGKPSKNAVETVLNMKEFSSKECIVVGDRLNTDIVMANENSMRSFLVLSGVTDRDMLKRSEIHPDEVLESIKDLPEAL